MPKIRVTNNTHNIGTICVKIAGEFTVDPKSHIVLGVGISDIIWKTPNLTVVEIKIQDDTDSTNSVKPQQKPIDKPKGV